MHVIVLGATGSGKSLGMKKIVIPSHRRLGRKVLVLDPLEQPGWNADFQTSDPTRFLAVAKASRRCVLVIDEWPHFMETYGNMEWRQLIWCYTIARNFGHLAYAIGQTPAWIPKPVRRQCSQGLIYRMTDPNDCLDMAKQLGQPSVATLPQTLPLGTGLSVQPGREPQRFVLFN